jgi:hypothetical protein
MKMILLFLVVAVSMAMTSALNLYMAKGAKGTASKSVNMPRKLKRSLRNADKGTFESLVNKPETESFIKQLPDGLLYENLMKMEQGEIDFWNKVGIDPNYIYEFAEPGWEQYL